MNVRREPVEQRAAPPVSATARQALSIVGAPARSLTRRRIHAALAAVVATLGGCAAPLPETIPSDGSITAAVPSEVARGGEPLTPAEVFGLDAGMRSFVSEHMGTAKTSQAKLRRLLAGMEQQGLFSLDYAGTTTQTARETFHGLRGNCLSFTILFVALAREAGLRVSFQIVDVPPSWSTVSDQIVLTNHINAIVKDSATGDYIVDFNDVEFRGNYGRREVSDEYALALFYSNVGAEALIERDFEKSYANLMTSVQTYPLVASPWTNLGLLYTRQGLYEQAETAYLRALDVDRRDGSTLTNLVALYTLLGKEQLAASYRARIERYQRRNPYYHFALAEQAYREHRIDDVLNLLATAIRLEPGEHRFYFLRGLALVDAGRTADAIDSLNAARERAVLDETKRNYDAKLQELSAQTDTL